MKDQQKTNVQMYKLRLRKQRVYTRDVGGGGHCLFYCLLEGLRDILKIYDPPRLRRWTEKHHVFQKKNRLYFREASSAAMTMNRASKIASTLYQDPAISVEDRRKGMKQWHKDQALWLRMGFDDEEAVRLSRIPTKTMAIEKARTLTRSSSHWGGEFDIALFQQLTGVGVLVFRVHQNGILNCVAQDHTYPYYILLYNETESHFTLAGIQDPTGCVRSVFSRGNLPVSLLRLYKKECGESLLL